MGRGGAGGAACWQARERERAQSVLCGSRPLAAVRPALCVCVCSQVRVHYTCANMCRRGGGGAWIGEGAGRGRKRASKKKLGSAHSFFFRARLSVFFRKGKPDALSLSVPGSRTPPPARPASLLVYHNPGRGTRGGGAAVILSRDVAGSGHTRARSFFFCRAPRSRRTRARPRTPAPSLTRTPSPHAWTHRHHPRPVTRGHPGVSSFVFDHTSTKRKKRGDRLDPPLFSSGPSLNPPRSVPLPPPHPHTRPTMSWQQYVDEHLMVDLPHGGRLTSAAIVGQVKKRRREGR